MIKRLRVVLAAFALAVPWVVMPQAATAAGADTFVMTGSGTFSPGLGLTPQAQSLSFTGTATVVGTDGVAATYSCSITGGEFLGELAFGAGNASGGCAPPKWCRSWTYVRVGAKWVWVCTATVLNPSVGVMDCLFSPSDVNPTTNFTLVCAGKVGDAA